ncbi:type VI secretion system protein TssA [Rubrivirga sp. IMCC45206]|uniref:type VI secretion system protein TssA n=1 Tax=Rubrivirga sp. IMCC45206 TaxID=3391614 RepID=UPI00398FC71C
MADESPPPDGDAFTTPRLDAIRAPISGDAPAGIDVKYDDDFQALKTHVDDLGAATGDVDFDAIVDLGTAILSAKSKDLAVVGYLMLGLSRTEGLAGLGEGVAAVRAVAEGFWEGAFPPLRRMRGRQAALQFVAERAMAFVKDTKATPDDREVLERLEADTVALQAFVTEAMGEDAPAYSGLLREVRESLRRLPTPEPETPDPPPEPAPSDGAGDAPTSDTPSAPRPAAPASGAGGGDASFSTAKEAALVVMKVAQFHREADALDAVAFGLVRAVRWGAIAAPPPTGKIPAPPKPRRDALAALVGGPPAALVAQGEAAFQQSPFHFWLDLQRLVATGLAALGPSAAAAHATVVDGTASLVRRLPGLASTTFQDGTPFADPLTVSWLDEISASPGASGGGGGDEALAEALDAAHQQAAGGDVPGAVAALVAGAGGPRDRFGRAIAAAELALGAGRPDVALALLDGVDDAVRAHRLDEWDPAAAAPALRLLHAACAALRAAPGSPARKAALSDRADDAFARLARIDPAHALRTAAPGG